MKHMRMKKLLERLSYAGVLVVFVLAAVASLCAQEKEAGDVPPDTREGAPIELPAFPLFESEAFARADFNALVEEGAAFIRKHPDSPQAELLMKVAYGQKDRATNFEIFEPVLEEILEKDLENGFNEEMYREYLARFYYRRGLREKAERTRTYAGYVLDCLILGSFGTSYRTCLEEVYEPEKDLLQGEISAGLVGKEYVGTDEFRRIKWMEYPYETPVRSPSVSPFTHLRSSGGCAFVLIQARSSAVRPVLVDIRAGRFFKMWVNRKLVLDVNSDRKREPYSHLAAVKFGEGWNHILRDVKGRLIEDMELEKGFVIHPVETGESPVYEGEYNGGAAKYYSELAGKNGGDPMAHVAYSYMLASLGMDVLALEEAQEALELAPGNLFVAYYASTRYMDAPHYPRAMARNKAKELWDRIVEANPGFVLAHEKIADYLVEDDKDEEAIKNLNEKVVDKDLGNIGTHRRLLRFFDGRKWEREKMAQLREIEKIDPGSEWLYDWWAQYYSRLGNPEKSWEFTTKSHQLNQSGTWYLNRKASRLERRGRLDEAVEIYLEILKLRPDYYSVLDDIARIYRRQGKYAEAIKQREKFMKMRPESPYDFETIGDIYREWGKEDKAVENYRKSLVLDPGQWTLRRYVQYLEGEDEDFSKPYAISDEEVMELVRSAPGKEAFPKASNLKVLDEEITKILPDGSSASYVHKVYKILDISGKDRHSTPYVGGELIEVRTIQPDGTILEPTSVYGSFTMPSLGEGVCIEYKYRTDGGWGRARRPEYETDLLYFQDEGYDEPVMKCRRVLIVSKKPEDEKTLEFLARSGRLPWSILDFCELKQNKVEEGQVEFETEEIGNTVVYSWSSENMPRIEPEPFMPLRKEVLPNAYFVSRRTWDDFSESLRERTLITGVIPTRRVREKAKEIVGEREGQYEQIEALYEWCMKEIKGGWGSGEAHTVLLEKSGSRDTLFMAFLNALGIPFDHILVGPDPYVEPDTEWEIPRAHYFGSSVMRVKPADHDPLYVTLGTRYMPLGKIPESVQGGPIYIPGEGITGDSMPRESLDDRSERESFDVDLGKLTCRASLVYPSARSYGRKEYYKDMPVIERKQAVERQANRYFPGAVLLGPPELPELEKIGRVFEIRFECKAPNFLNVKKDGSVVAKTGIEPLEMQQRYADKATREFDMVLRSENLARTSVTIRLGGKYDVVQLPESVNLRNEFGTYVLTFSSDKDTIEVKRRFTLLPQRIKTDRYEDFLEFCRKIDESELGRIILSEKASVTSRDDNKTEEQPEKEIEPEKQPETEPKEK
jgi:tetratricopeptide (TPR) repeat protein